MSVDKKILDKKQKIIEKSVKGKDAIADIYKADEMNEIAKKVKKIIVKVSSNPREEFSSKNKPKLKTNTVLDDILGHGGIVAGKVIEFSGEYGSGKTQSVNTLMAEATQSCPEYPNGGTVVLVNVEDTFSTERMEQILTERGLNVEQFWKNFIIITPDDWIEQIAAYEQIPSNHDLNIQGKPPLRLIVVDSLLCHLDSDDSFEGRQKLPVRSRVIRVHLVGKLKKLAKNQQCAVVFTNQVQDVPDVTKYTPTYMRQRAKGGRTLEHVPDIVLFFRKAGTGNIRIARVMDSQELPPLERVFQINNKGIDDVEEQVKDKYAKKTKREEEIALSNAEKTEIDIENEAEAILDEGEK